MLHFHLKNSIVASLSIFSLSLILCSCSSRTHVREKIIDLSYPFDDKTVYWPTEKDFILEQEIEGFTKKGYYYAANRFQAAEHGGTHVDAPKHFSEKGRTVDQIPLEQLIGPAILIDVSEKCIRNPDYQIAIEDFLEWESRNGRMPQNIIILLRTGFGKYWPDRLRYMGTNERGAEAVQKLHFPGLHPEAARWLLEFRKIKAIGLDTPSIDYGQSNVFDSHVILFQKNIPALENLANLEQLPQKNFKVVALPMKIKGGTGAPIRMIAIIIQEK